ncbi:hypothetical protein [Williamsia sp.]|uniref:hypothetical protein n=1 Tax=Williamsia sp. TaxID=1872085 RepID=UPI001A2712BE|nr:hypothetical protein [Williamsia sp.]MBJ7287573.1 hypothetical protein [Williamsia sp.]
MTAPEPRPPLSAAGLIEMLQQIARANYDQAAINQSSSDGETYELVADVITRAIPADWSRYARDLPSPRWPTKSGHRCPPQARADRTLPSPPRN